MLVSWTLGSLPNQRGVFDCGRALPQHRALVAAAPWLKAEAATQGRQVLLSQILERLPCQCLGVHYHYIGSCLRLVLHSTQVLIYVVPAQIRDDREYCAPT